MNWWIKFGCMLTGWSSGVLSQCSEASKCQLSKYTSALLILILIWGVTGFCFAQRYIGLPTWACGFVSLFFITIVIMIERQIILTSEKTFSMVAFRAIIAFIMAIVGSTIFDQTMFGKDIDKQMTNTIEIQVADLTNQRVRIIDEKLAALHMEIDSIDRINAVLQADINANPFVIQPIRWPTLNRHFWSPTAKLSISCVSKNKSGLRKSKTWKKTLGVNARKASDSWKNWKQCGTLSQRENWQVPFT